MKRPLTLQAWPGAAPIVAEALRASGAESGDASLSVVAPCLATEATRLAPVIEGYRQGLSALSAAVELIVVTDGHRPPVTPEDGSSVTIRHVTATGGGWGRAVRAGLDESTGKTLCYLNPAKASPPVLLEAVTSGLLFRDAVVRVNRRTRDSLRQRIGSLAFNIECRLMLDLSVWDVNGTPKVFPRTFDRLLTLSSDDELIDAEFTVVCQQAGYPVIELPVHAAAPVADGARATSVVTALRLYANVRQLRSAASATSLR